MPLITLDGYDIMPYRVLQHLSSILGLALLMFIIFRWYRKTKPANDSVSYWSAPIWLKTFSLVSLFLFSILLALSFAYSRMPDTDVLFGLYSAQKFLKYAIVSGAGMFLLSSIMVGLLYQYMINKK